MKLGYQLIQMELFLLWLYPWSFQNEAVLQEKEKSVVMTYCIKRLLMWKKEKLQINENVTIWEKKTSANH